MKRISPRPLVLVPIIVLTTSLLGGRPVLFGPWGRVSRGKLLSLGGLGLTALAAAGWRDRVAEAAGATESPSAAAAPTLSCVLTPEQTEGPYYIAKEKVRSNLTEGKPGIPLALRLGVVDATTCAPLKGAVVDIWHCDATGSYSGFESASAGGPPGGSAGPTSKHTFLRGIQVTNARGVCTFQTIYPGWYRGRTTHIHVKVHLGGSVIHTGQLYFPDSLTDKVYQTGPYRARAAARDTRNSTDGIYANGGSQSTLTLKHAGTHGYTGAMTLGVRRA